MYFRKGLDGSVSATLFGSISELELSEKSNDPFRLQEIKFKNKEETFFKEKQQKT